MGSRRCSAARWCCSLLVAGRHRGRRCWRWSGPAWSPSCTRAPSCRLGTTKLVGQRAVVTERITGLAVGRIKLAGEIWSAAPYDEHVTIEPGATVEVFEIRGATAYVHPVAELGE